MKKDIRHDKRGFSVPGFELFALKEDHEDSLVDHLVRLGVLQGVGDVGTFDENVA